MDDPCWNRGKLASSGTIGSPKEHVYPAICALHKNSQCLPICVHISVVASQGSPIIKKHYRNSRRLDLTHRDQTPTPPPPDFLLGITRSTEMTPKYGIPAKNRKNIMCANINPNISMLKQLNIEHTFKGNQPRNDQKVYYSVNICWSLLQIIFGVATITNLLALRQMAALFLSI